MLKTFITIYINSGKFTFGDLLHTIARSFNFFVKIQVQKKQSILRSSIKCISLSVPVTKCSIVHMASRYSILQLVYITITSEQ